MRKFYCIACCILLSVFINCHAEKIGTASSLLVMQGGIGMQIDVENVEKNVPFNAFVDWIGNVSYNPKETFQGSLALALISDNGELKEIIHEVNDIRLESDWGYGRLSSFCNVSVRSDFDDTDIIRFITKQRDSSEWLPVNSNDDIITYCKVKDNIVHKADIKVNCLGPNKIPYNGYCEATYGDSFQPEPIYSSAYNLKIDWPVGKDHHYLKVEPFDGRIQIDRDRILFQVIEHPEYNVTLMACSDDELIMEQRHYNVNVPGSLHEQLENDPDVLYINNIAVSGEIDDSDIYFIRDKMPMVEHIDLSKAYIVGGKLPDSAFEEKGIKSLILPEDLLELGYNCLRKTKLYKLTIPASVCVYDLNALNYSEDLTVVVLHNPTVIPISWCVLEGTNRANGVLFVPKGARENFVNDDQWGQFSMIVEGDNADDFVNEIDDTYQYTGVYPDVTITKVVQPYNKMIVPETVELNGRTFSVSGIGSRVFASYTINEIFIPKSITSISEFAIESNACLFLKSVVVDENNPNYFSEGGVLYDRANSVMLNYPPAKEDIEYSIPEGIKEIYGWACYNYKLHRLIMPSTMETIGACAFCYCHGMDSEAEIICKAVIPPKLGTTAFADVTYFNARVYVPEGSLELYKSDPKWSSFFNFYPLNDENGLEDVEIDERWISIDGNTVNLAGNECIEIYSIDGRLI
ncbi:MAG: leucine-rich repeat domain-containing protein, partial [Muribaculaceae bacterium]|nr:leucine-rich repeat domain-containing protein [Muribaculaceae bacterium]